VSLRTDFHSAFDVVAPSTLGLPERVLETVVAQTSNRRRTGRLILRLRAPVSLVAAILVIALVAAVLVGGRVVQDWNFFRNAVPAVNRGQSELQRLESRPLHIPVVRSPAECRSGPFRAPGGGYLGSGPVYAGGGPSTDTRWGTYFYDLAFVDTQINGPVLVRARDLFTHQAVVFVGPYAIGPEVGKDMLHGTSVQQHTEVLLDPANASTPSSPDPRLYRTPYRYAWEFTAGVPSTWSGSTGWQIDGAGFSEVFLSC
jgi:hypothetical protein